MSACLLYLRHCQCCFQLLCTCTLGNGSHDKCEMGFTCKYSQNTSAMHCLPNFPFLFPFPLTSQLILPPFHMWQYIHTQKKRQKEGCTIVIKTYHPSKILTICSQDQSSILSPISGGAKHIKVKIFMISGVCFLSQIKEPVL